MPNASPSVEAKAVKLWTLPLLVLIMRCFTVLWLGLMLSACAVPGPMLEARSPTVGITAAQPGTRFALDPAHSVVRIHAFRAGRAANLGHNHVLTVPRLDGVLLLPLVDSLAGARFELAFRLDELAVDLPDMRAALGPGWASLMTTEAIAATRANMLGESNLQAARFPGVVLYGRQIVGELPKLVAELEVELHGQRRTQWVALQAERTNEVFKARGTLVVRQSDFGIAPFSVLGGLLAVRDELLIEFEIQTSPSKGSTSTNSPASTSP